MLGIRTSSFPTNFWTPRREFVEYKDSVPEPQPTAYDKDPIMEDKRQIIEDRKALKEKTTAKGTGFTRCQIVEETG